MIAEDDTSSGMWLLRMMSTRCKDNSFERIAWDFRSLSLHKNINPRTCYIVCIATDLSWFSGFIVSLQSALKTRNASLMNRSFVDIAAY